MDERRFLMEKHYLEKRFPRRFAFQDMNTDHPHLVCSVKSQTGNNYRLKITLNNYPAQMPAVFVTYPYPLEGYDMDDLADEGVSGPLHLLRPDDEGHVQICHYKKSDWSGTQTLSHVMIHAKIWLDAYEKYMRDGTDLEFYLKH